MSKGFLNSLKVLFLAAAMVSLAACGESETTTSTGASGEPTTTAEAPVNTTENTETPSNDKDLFVAVLSEASNLDSFSAEMIADQQMDIAGQEMNTKTESTMDIIMKPELAFKQITKVEMAGQSQEIESYYTKDGFFLLNPETSGWMKLPSDMMNTALQGVDQEALDPTAQLEQLLDYADQFTVEEKDGIYNLTLKAEGEAFSELIQSALEGQELPVEGLSMDINTLEYLIQVEKDTKKLLAIDVTMDMIMDSTEEGEPVKITSEITTKYSNHNGIKEIVLPEEALNAQEVTIPQQ